MTKRALVGIDVGTSSAKTVVLSEGGDLLAVAAQEYPVDTPYPGWAEQAPEAWVRAALTTTREALSEAGVAGEDVLGLGLSGQMHGTVCVGDQGELLRPAIIWADQRSRAEVAEVVAKLGRDRLASWTGNPVATGFMLPTWLWLREHEPEVAAATRWLLLPKDYVRYRLTGEIGAEPSDASSTSFFDPVDRSWSTPLLEALDLDGRRLPDVHPSSAVAGGLRQEMAEAAGLPCGLPVIFGGSDQAMQALGNGVLAPGVVSSTIGTGGQLFAPTEHPVVDAPELRMHSFCHVLPDRWHVETAMLAAGLSLRWLRDQILTGETYEAMADAAQSVSPGAEGLLFQPYLAGERTPHMDPRARGSFVGLTLRHGRAHFVRALMEGVVFSMRQGLDLMAALGVPITTIVASGGATRHPLWMQLQADIYDRPIRRTETVEAAATGAAMLAGVGVGVFPDAAAAIEAAVRWSDEVVEPTPERAEIYRSHYERFRELYPALVGVMHALDAA
ncbi:MAG: xylulokinase [Anaerolineae bacterium]